MLGRWTWEAAQPHRTKLQLVKWPHRDQQAQSQTSIMRQRFTKSTKNCDKLQLCPWLGIWRMRVKLLARRPCLMYVRAPYLCLFCTIRSSINSKSLILSEVWSQKQLRWIFKRASSRAGQINAFWWFNNHVIQIIWMVLLIMIISQGATSIST